LFSSRHYKPHSTASYSLLTSAILLLSYSQYEPHSTFSYSLLTSAVLLLSYSQYEPHSTASHSLLTSPILDFNLLAAITLSEIFSWLKKTFRLCFSLYVKWGTLSTTAKRLSCTSHEKQTGTTQINAQSA